MLESKEKLKRRESVPITSFPNNLSRSGRDWERDDEQKGDCFTEKKGGNKNAPMITQ
jgi:hypothetical protein